MKVEKVDLPRDTPVVSLGDGPGLVDDLFKAVERTTIRVFYDSPVHDLIMEG